MSDEEDYTNIRNRGGNSSASSRESSPRRANKRSFSPASDDDFVAAPDNDDNTPPPQAAPQVPLLRKSLAFGATLNTTVQTYEPTPAVPTAASPAFLPGQGQAKSKRKRRKANDAAGSAPAGNAPAKKPKKAQAKQVPSFKVSDYNIPHKEPTPAPEPVSTLGVVSGGPYNSAFRVSEDAQQSHYRSHVFESPVNASPQPGSSMQGSHIPLSSQPEISRQATQPSFNSNPYRSSAPPNPSLPLTVHTAATPNPHVYSTSHSPAPSSFSPAVTSPAYTTTNGYHEIVGTRMQAQATVQTISTSAGSVASTASYQSVHNAHQDNFLVEDAPDPVDFHTAEEPPHFELQRMPSPAVAPQQEQPSRHTVPSPLKAASFPTRDSPAPSVARPAGSSPNRTVTLLIHDQRSGVTDSQLAEVFVPLRQAEDPSDGFWADAVSILGQLQNGPARIDGPARLYTMRGKYRQFLLRVSADQKDDIAKASINICCERTLDLVVEMLQIPGAPILPPKIPKDLLYGSESEGDENTNGIHTHGNPKTGPSPSVPPSSAGRMVRSAS